MDVEIRELPPDDMRGREMPVIGSIPIFIPMLTNTWMDKVANTPIHRSLLISSLAVVAISKIVFNK